MSDSSHLLNIYCRVPDCEKTIKPGERYALLVYRTHNQIQCWNCQVTDPAVLGVIECVWNRVLPRYEYKAIVD